MKTLVPLLSMLVLSASVFAEDTTCMSQAAEKKLLGAAQGNFVHCFGQSVSKGV